MSTTPLEIIVTGNVKNATAGLQDVQKELAKTAVVAQKTDSSLSAGLNQLATNVKGTFSSINGALEPFERNIHSAFHGVVEEATGASQGIAKFATGIFSALGPIALFAGVLALPKIIEFTKSLFDASEATKQARQNLINLNSVIQEANKDAAKQIDDLKILYEVSTNVSLSMKDRLAAVKGLQTEFPEFFKNIKTETILNGDAKKQYDELTLSIIANSRAKAAKAKIDELEAQVLDAEFQKQKILNAATNETNRQLAKPVNANQGGIGQSNNQGKILQAIQDRKKVAIGLQDSNIKILRDQEDFLTKFAGLPTLAKVIEGEHKPKKEKSAFEEDLQALQKNYEEVQKLRKKELDANISDIKQNGIVVADFLLQDQITFLTKKGELLRKFNKSDFENFKELEKAKQELIDRNLEFTKGANQDNVVQLIANIKTPQIDFGKLAIGKINTVPILQMTEDLKRLYKKLYGDEIDFTKQFNEILSSGLSNAFSSVAESIGKALSGVSNPIEGVFNAIFLSLASLLQTLGEALINAAVKVLIAKKTFFKILLANPVAAIAIGAGLVAFGALLKSEIQKSVPGFATGVQNFAGGAAIVGENGPELVTLPRGASVIPNNQINAGTMNQNLQVFGRIEASGSNLVVVIDRARATNSRNG